MRISAEFAEVIRDSEARIKRGELDDPAAEILAKLGPEDAAPAVHLLVAGNILYKLSPKDSYRLHMKALAKEPGSKLASIEGAYEFQRAGKYAEACALWDGVLGVEPDRTVAKALRAHCRLAAGDIKGAVESWTGLSGEDHHNIETAACEVFGPPQPLARRKELLDEAAGSADQDSAAARIVVHDLTWEVDWWNSRPNVEQAEADLKKFEGKLSQNVRLPLELLVRLNKAAKAGGIPGDEAGRLKTLLTKYPDRVSTPVLRKLVAVADEQSLFRKIELLAWLRPTLEARMASAEGSGDDGLLLASLADSVDKALMERTDALCAEKYDQKNCVISALVSKAGAGELKTDDPLLQRTLKNHPDWVYPHFIALKLLTEQDPGWPEALRRLTIAEFHELELGSPVHGPHNATGLMSFFRYLEKTIK